jgi:hypothetical protein
VIVIYSLTETNYLILTFRHIDAKADFSFHASFDLIKNIKKKRKEKELESNAPEKNFKLFNGFILTEIFYRPSTPPYCRSMWIK